MKFAQSKQSWLRATVAATALLAAVAGTATVASAASVGISGTVYNNQTYYRSATIRTAGMGFINIQLDSRPSRNIMWRLWSSNLGKTFGNNPEITNNSSYSLATGVITGTRFQNEYAQGHGSCVFSCGYNFSGTQTY